MAVTEGGYDLQALGQGLDQTVEVLSGRPGPRHTDSDASGRASGCAGIGGRHGVRGRAAVNAVKAVQRRYWSTL